MSRFVSMPADAYHADLSAWSRSMLSTFRESKREAYLRYVAKEAPKDESKECMTLGSLAHTMLLEPAKVKERFAIIPESCLSPGEAIRSKDAKQFVDDAEAEGLEVVKPKAYKRTEKIIESVKQTCGQWLNKATHIEQSVYWADDVTKLPMKARPDWLIETANDVYMFDLKTTTRIIPHTFAKVIEAHEYWLQDSHYRQGVFAVLKKPVQMFFVGIEQEWPYRAGIFQLSPETRQKAFETWRTLVNDVATAIETNNFSDPWEKEITTVTLKDYVFRSNA